MAAVTGVQFPQNAKGERSTTEFNKDVFSAVSAALGCDELSKSISAEKNWRQKYTSTVDDVIECLSVTSLLDTKKMAIAMKAGLAKACDMEFVATDGSSKKLADVLKSPAKAFETATIKGTGAIKNTAVMMYNGRELDGEALDTQVDYWSSVGTLEPSCAEAIKSGAKKTAQLKGRLFLVLGASSELGAVRALLESGATVAAVMRPSESRWADLIEFAKSSAGTLLVPTTGACASPKASPKNAATEDTVKVAGADLLQDAPGVLQWLTVQAKASRTNVTLCTYLYADGEANVRLSVAADAISVSLAAALGKSKLSFAYLASSSTSHLISQEAVDGQAKNFDVSNYYSKFVGKRSECSPGAQGSALWRTYKSDGAPDYHFFRGLLNMQGPNYALSQYMRQWRAALLHMDGFKVSSPVAPMCRTESVVRNGTMKAVLDGAAYWRPMEALDANTARMAMFAVLVSELTEPVPKLASPMLVCTRDAFHSGLWRCPFALDSLGMSSFVLGKVLPRSHTKFALAGA